MLERITKSKKEIIDRALEILKKHKGIFLDCLDFTNNAAGIFGTSAIIVEDTMTRLQYCYHIQAEVFEDQRLSNESKTLPFDDVVALRVAHFIFEAYSAAKQKELNDAIDDTLTSSANQTVQTLKCGSISYDIGVNGRSLTAAYNDLDDARDKIKELEEKNEQLEQEVKDLKMYKDIIWQTLQQKGIL